MITSTKIALSILIPTKNEIKKNISRCVEPLLEWADEIIVIDSGSTDGTIEYCLSQNVNVINFNYEGGWPKKRQWALDNHSFKNKWVLLLDADEILSQSVKDEIQNAISEKNMMDSGSDLKYFSWANN